MTPQRQRFIHRPETGQWGDCHRTAIACLLDIPVQASPHFIGEYERRERLKAMGDEMGEYSWRDEQEKFLNAIGYTCVTVGWQGTTALSALLEYFDVVNPGRYYILVGQSPRGTNHSVIACGGELVWDPHPEGGFLVGPMDNGVWEVNFILPASMKAIAK